MMRWNIGNRIAEKGWTRANHLAIGAGLTYPVARRVWQSVERGDPIDRLDADTLEKLRLALTPTARTPWALLEYKSDPATKGRRR